MLHVAMMVWHTYIAIIFVLFLSSMTSGLPLYLSHIGSSCQKDGGHTVMMPRQSFGKWSDSCEQA